MIRILIFLGLKVAEIGLIVFVPYWVGRLVDRWWDNSWDDGFLREFAFWLQGLASLLLISILIITLVSVFPNLISLNWQWAGQIIQCANK